LKTLRIYLLAAALIAAATVFYTKAVAPTEPLDSDTVISLPAAPTVYTGEQQIFGVSVSQTVYGSAAEETIQSVNQLLYEFESHWEGDGADTVPGRIAASAGLEPVTLDAADYAVVRRAFDLAEETGGLFDPTIGSLSALWRQGEPTADKRSWALTYTGWEQVTLSDEEGTVSILHPGIAVDFCAVVKGMAVQAALETYQQAEIDGALLCMDGAAVMTGRKGDGTAFSLGLADPLQADGSFYGILRCTDRVICTADADSQLLDPKTGELAESDLAAVSVIGADGFLCDAMSSILYMQGMDAVKAHLSEADYSLIAVGKNGDILLSDDLRESFTLTDTENFRLVD
jgi:thiamine biosynthesis lipoprotein